MSIRGHPSRPAIAGARPAPRRRAHPQGCATSRACRTCRTGSSGGPKARPYHRDGRGQLVGGQSSYFGHPVGGWDGATRRSARWLSCGGCRRSRPPRAERHARCPGRSSCLTQRDAWAATTVVPQCLQVKVNTPLTRSTTWAFSRLHTPQRSRVNRGAIEFGIGAALRRLESLADGAVTGSSRRPVAATAHHDPAG